MSSNIEELGKMMNVQMKNVMSANSGVMVELGVINSNMSLSVASLGNAIPKGDYMVSLHLTKASLILDTTKVELETGTAEAHKHSVASHGHKVTIPAKLRELKAGDRVLVVWCGTEPVVVDIVVSS